MCDILPMECCSAIRNINRHNKVDIKTITLSRSQTQKTRYRMISLTWNSLKDKSIKIENRSVVAWQRGWGWGKAGGKILAEEVIGKRKLLGEMAMFILLMVMVISWVYTRFESYLVVHHKHVQFTK